MERSALVKECLKTVFLMEAGGREVSASSLSEVAGRTRGRCRETLRNLEGLGLVERKRGRRFLGRGGREGLKGSTSATYGLSEKGRAMIRVVLAGGVFDIVHVGHLATLREAKDLGDLLVVVVARDGVVEANKGRRPLNSEENRVRLVNALKPVDLVVLGNPADIYKTVEQLKPDVIALGYDQKHEEEEFKKELRRRGQEASIVRLKASVPKVKTSELLAKIEELNAL
jgi:FAD synthetase